MPSLYSCSKCGKYFSPEFSDGQSCPNCKTKLSGLKQAKKTQIAGWIIFICAIIGCAIGQIFSDLAAFFGLVLGIFLPIIILSFKNK